MEFFIFLIVSAILIEYLRSLKRKERKREKNAIVEETPDKFPKDLPYAKSMLLTKAEYAFYKVLKEKCDQMSLLICPKVRMEDFLDITDKKNSMKWRGYIRSRHIDFLVTDDKLHIMCGIELDDNSHKSKDVIETDNFKDNVFRTIGIPLHRIKMSDGMYEDQLTRLLLQYKKSENVGSDNGQ